jgi:hypothetical protein
MRKVLILSAIACSLLACKKEQEQKPEKVKYYIKIVAVDNDGITHTETNYKTIIITK